ncbi:MAG: exodeoxyribonuclease VII large subunit [Actinomycetota bacterium]|nr:exodeoxyribonuclease VII large subunit [Actinomycetota bacterium]
MSNSAARPAGIPGSVLTGPWPVGQYAAAMRERLRGFARVQLFGELVNFKLGQAKVWFELRDGAGALPCSMWRREWEASEAATMTDGAMVVVAGGCDFYPGSSTSSPSFTFAVSEVRLAGEGELLAQIERLRRRLVAEGLCELQAALPRPGLPKTIGVVCGEHGKARDDVVAGLKRRGWAGRLVWAFAPVQDRHAAPAIGRALQDLAACAEADVVIVARGGGSLADLLAFCDETLCRTVALLRIPVIASVGHHTDRTLIDDVAAISCSTPTHAAEAAVSVDCAAARAQLHDQAGRLERQGRRAVLDRARSLAGAARAPAEHAQRHRDRLRRQLAQLQGGAQFAAAGARREHVHRAQAVARAGLFTRAWLAEDRAGLARRTAGLERTSHLLISRRHEAIVAAGLAVDAHDPQRTLERGYALVEDPQGEPVISAAAARTLEGMRVRLHDGSIDVRRLESR